MTRARIWPLVGPRTRFDPAGGIGIPPDPAGSRYPATRSRTARIQEAGRGRAKGQNHGPKSTAMVDPGSGMKDASSGPWLEPVPAPSDPHGPGWAAGLVRPSDFSRDTGYQNHTQPLANYKPQYWRGQRKIPSVILAVWQTHSEMPTNLQHLTGDRLLFLKRPENGPKPSKTAIFPMISTILGHS